MAVNWNKGGKKAKLIIKGGWPSEEQVWRFRLFCTDPTEELLLQLSDFYDNNIVNSKGMFAYQNLDSPLKHTFADALDAVSNSHYYFDGFDAANAKKDLKTRLTDMVWTDATTG